MLNFECDYLEGAHPRILEKLMATNMEKTSGYGQDPYTASAAQKILTACNCPDGEVRFLLGGTQTNATVINAMLHTSEGVIAADTGHISTHEAGAIEAGGHKVLTIPQVDGKLTAAGITHYMQNFLQDASHTHMPQPGMVYVSHPTEYGTLYSKAELEAIRAVCREYALPLFLDGARLGYGLAAVNTDVTLPVIAENCDVFYIGGTKVGAMFGEAVVVTKANSIKHFFTTIKQNGALLAKGRMLGIQFDVLFTDNLYVDISAHAIRLAEKLKANLRAKGYPFFFESPTNQQFVILENTAMAALAEKAQFSVWEPYDDTHTVVRFATSWATNEQDLDSLLALL
ncbi:threonine aldolase family protein [Kurthia huakuii]|uniref:threonine aldolase family protein n=1 Tax=Kurthia huakuii TaxID=1421019 RepID=UPI00049670B7|nr:beta-eliminating lyase-related protein [Kurthia huakuii]MBM7699742.1 threonine aldolase [Kurthia huakuii]